MTVDAETRLTAGVDPVIVIAMLIAYAPKYLAQRLPWLIEVEVDTGHVVAYLADANGNLMTCSKPNALRAEFDSLGVACERYGLDARNDLELRWWTEPSFERGVAAEMLRLGVAGTIEPSKPGVIVHTALGSRRVTGAFDLYRTVRDGFRSAST